MLEGCRIGEIVSKQTVHDRLAVLNEAAVGVGIDAPHCGGHNDPGAAFGTLGTAGGVGAIIILDGRQAIKSFTAGFCNSSLIPIGIQSGQRHTGNIGVGGESFICHQRPAAVIVLCFNDSIDTLLTDGRIRGRIVVGIQCDQRPNGAVQTLLLDPGETVGAVGFHKIPITYGSSIDAQRRQCNDQAGVLSGLGFMQSTAHIDFGSCGIDGLHNAVVVIGEVGIVLGIVTSTCKAQYGPLTCGSTKDRLSHSCSQLCHSCIQRFSDTLCFTRLLRLLGSRCFCCGYGNLRIGRCRNDHIGVFIAIATICPQNPASCFGEGDLSAAASISGDGAGGIAIRSAVVHGVVTCVIDNRTSAHTGVRANQLHGAGSTCFCGVVMDKCAAFIGKEVETIIGIHIEVPTGEAADVDKVSGFQHDLIGGSTPAFTGQRILTIQEVVQVFIEAKDAALEVGTAGGTGEGHFAEISAVEVFVGIDDHVQSGDVIGAISVFIVLVLTQTVFIQINGC